MTTKADTSVKYFRSDMSGAPTATNAIGSLIGILDACLVDGFCVRTPDSVVVSGGVAEVSLGAGNPYKIHTVVLVSGASNPALNGEWKVATSGASSLTFACPGIADGVITGVSLRLAPAGWGVPFTATNKRVYQSLDPNSSQAFFRFDNTANPCSHRGYMNMTSVDVGTDEFPTTSSQAVSCWLTSTSTAIRKWTLIADGSFLYFSVYVSGATANGNAAYLCGDLVRFFPNDRYAVVTQGSSNTSSSVAIYVAPDLWNNINTAPNGPITSPRGIDGTGGARVVGTHSNIASNSTGASGEAYPEGGLGVVVGYPVFARQGIGANQRTRGTIPGAMAIHTNMSAFTDTFPFEFLEIPGLPNKFFTPIKLASGTALVDVTGPWR